MVYIRLMRLGILVNTDRHPGHLVAISRAAHKRGHEISAFFMDRGVMLLDSREVHDLLELTGVSMAFCEVSATSNGLDLDALPPDIKAGIKAGSQLDNALMMRDSEKVIAL